MLTRRPRWADVLAANHFQLLFKHLQRLLPPAAARQKVPCRAAPIICLPADDLTTRVPVQPSECFNSMAFFSLMERAHDRLCVDAPGEEGEEEEGAAHEAGGAASGLLPIDAHRDEILRRIERDRVVIIHGETGAGPCVTVCDCVVCCLFSPHVTVIRL